MLFPRRIAYFAEATLKLANFGAAGPGITLNEFNAVVDRQDGHSTAEAFCLGDVLTEVHHRCVPRTRAADAPLQRATRAERRGEKRKREKKTRETEKR